jgi:hypothetical protein
MSSMRTCACGMELSGINRSPKCWNCRARDKEIKHQQEPEAARAKREPERLERIAELRKSGLVLLHSCISNIHDAAPLHCNCRKWYGSDKAKILISRGEAVDYATRQACWRGGDLCVSGTLLRTPRSAGIERAHIERSLSTISKEKTPEQLKIEFDDLQRRILLDRTERAEEERYRWDVWAELQAKFFASIAVEVPAEKFDIDQKEAYGRPRILTTENRSCVGRDVFSFESGETPASPWKPESEDTEMPEESEEESDDAQEDAKDQCEEPDEENEIEEIAAASIEENTDEYERQ